jgi:hypothetical protein
LTFGVMMFSIRTVHLCGPRDHSISLLQTSSFGPNWRVTFTPDDESPWDELWNDTEAAGMTTGNMTDIFRLFRNFWLNRAQLCIDCDGGPL